LGSQRALYACPTRSSSRHAIGWPQSSPRPATSGSGEVKALARPSLSAWAVNQVYWQARPLHDALAASQRCGGQGPALRAALEERAALRRRRSGRILAAAGGTPRRAMRRIGSARSRHRSSPRPGIDPAG
jgi:hypothetical protein